MSSSDKYESNIFIDGPVFFMGDLHGDADALFEITERIGACRSVDRGEQQAPCNLIILGDIGMGFEYCTPYLTEAFRELSLDGWNIYLLRGNHDNPLYWTEKVEGATMLPDNKIITINGKRVFVSGGGTSIDRTQRVKNQSYWENEELFVPNHALREVGPVYAVLTHTGPVPPTVHNKSFISGWLREDRGLGADLELEQIQVSRLASMKPTYWLYGHYHVACDHEVNGIRCRALAEHEIVDGSPIFPYEDKLTLTEHEYTKDTTCFEASWHYDKKGTTYQERPPRPKGHVDVFVPFMGLYDSLDDLVEHQAFEYEVQVWQEQTEQKIKKLTGKFDLAGLMRDYVNVLADLLDLKTLQFAYLTYPREYNFQTNSLCCTISREELWKLYENRDKEMYDALVSQHCTPREGYMPYSTTTPDRFEFIHSSDFPEGRPEFMEPILDSAVHNVSSDYYVDGILNSYGLWVSIMDPHYINERLDTEVEEH